VVREITALITRRGKPGVVSSLHAFMPSCFAPCRQPTSSETAASSRHG
jgi:hypothetical protein